VVLLALLTVTSAASEIRVPMLHHDLHGAALIIPPTPHHSGPIGPFSDHSRGSEEMLLGLWLAPLAALLSTVASGLTGILAGYLAGRWERAAQTITAILLAIPWLLLLLLTSTVLSAPAGFRSVGFILIPLVQVGFVASTPVISNAARKLRDSAFVLHARASGQYGILLFTTHVFPYLKPILLAQFWISLFVFILGEAGLVLLGVGLGETAPRLDVQHLSKFLTSLSGIWSAILLLALLALLLILQLLLSREEPAVS